MSQQPPFQIQELYLDGMQLTAVEFACETNVDDECFAVLKSLPLLKTVSLSGTSITANAAIAFFEQTGVNVGFE